MQFHLENRRDPGLVLHLGKRFERLDLEAPWLITADDGREKDGRGLTSHAFAVGLDRFTTHVLRWVGTCQAFEDAVCLRRLTEST